MLCILTRPNEIRIMYVYFETGDQCNFQLLMVNKHCFGRHLTLKKILIQPSSSSSTTPQIPVFPPVPPDLPVAPSSGKRPSSSRGAAAAASQLGSKLRSRSASRPSATMLSTGYGTDNESVRTEDFETKFMSLMVGGGQGGVSDSDGGRPKPGKSEELQNAV